MKGEEQESRRSVMRVRMAVLDIAAIVVAAMVAAAGCGGPSSSGAQKTPESLSIQNGGSDTMVNLAQMWSEEYKKVVPAVSVEVGGGGTGVGMRDLMQGMIDIANASREIKDSEREQVRKNTGREAVQWVVGYDALAVYAHKDNPIETLTVKQLAGIYAEDGQIKRWSQLGVDMGRAGARDEIVLVSRQNSSGTYFFFREHVLGNKDFKLGSRDMSGSKDVVELVGRTLGAIGYSGMGYKTDAVKFVKVSEGEGKSAYGPSLKTVISGEYSLARPLYMYTLGQPAGRVKEYLDWILSRPGQDIVVESGYIPAGAAGGK